jgi:hypothetical protein
MESIERQTAEMGQMGKGFREEASFVLSSYPIQGKSNPFCSLAIGTSVKLIVYSK